MQEFKNKLYIMNKREARYFPYDNKLIYGVISIHTPLDDDLVRFPWNCTALHVGFFDIEKPMYIKPFNVDVPPMTPKQGMEIASFIGSFYDSVDKFIVHCDAGISRSAGVVRAILMWKYNEDLPLGDMVSYYSPNYHVFKTVYDLLKKLPINT